MTESSLQRLCNEYLRRRGVEYDHIEKGRGTNRTHRRGKPDLTIYPGDGKAFFIELKACEKQGLRPEQEEFFIRMRERGYYCERIWSIERFKELIDSALIKSKKLLPEVLGKENPEREHETSRGAR